MGEGLICQDCESLKQRPLRGVYNTCCLECCARLVAATNPDKAKAMSALESISRNKEAPKREEILARVRELINGSK